MSWIKKYFGDLFLPGRFFVMLACLTGLLITSFYIPPLTVFALAMGLVLVVAILADYFLLFVSRSVPDAKRMAGNRFSNGDNNWVKLSVQNNFNFWVHATVVDELPSQLQIRDWKKEIPLKPHQQKIIRWQLKPLQRGAYHFGRIHLYLTTRIGLVCRRFTVEAEETIPVYPSFMQLHQYGLYSGAALQQETGSQRLRKLGQSMEFEQIKDYVSGDDIRTLNWKATARKGALMVNSFMEERSQQIYCIIDKGRLMKMPFDGMTLLDYAINSCLVLSNVCLKKQDRVGVITFSNRPGSILAADRKPSQAENIMQLLFQQETDFLESDFEMLCGLVGAKIRHRSLLILFTNFESLSGLNRQIDYLRSLARNHLLLVVFFENAELDQLIDSPAGDIEAIYTKTIAEKFAFEKRVIAKELSKYGILSILASPRNLTIATLNKYLEIKMRQAI